MEINIDSIIPFDKLYSDLEGVFSSVEKNGKIILLKNNDFAFIITKYDKKWLSEAEVTLNEPNRYKLHEAMKIVLSEAPNNTMHASELADRIYERRLYLKKDGKKAEYTQIRARCGKYPHMFEALKKNEIKLKNI